jgi:membrane protein implicated in regulation of membrane protease activity
VDWQMIFLVCFVVGTAWVLLMVLLGGFHLHMPNLPHVHMSGHIGGGYPSHALHGVKFAQSSSGGSESRSLAQGVWLALLNPNAIAVFLAWFGGAGYLLSRHATVAFWLVLVLSAVLGLAGAYLIAFTMHWAINKEQPLDPADYEMVGVLGSVTSPVRPAGIGEMVFVRDGARRAVPVKSENGLGIERGTEVVVTRFERGVAYVETWAALVEGKEAGGEK